MARLTPEYIVSGLVKRGVPEHVAQGVVMNFQDESGLHTGIQEKDPTRGRGGFGLAQWTGIRRVALEETARARGVPVDDPELQLDFFMQENNGPEAGAWSRILRAPNAQEAAVAFVSGWERPAKKHELARIAKYRGDTPSEGGAKFGGTGLGDPANPVSVTTPAAPEYLGGAPVPGTPDKKSSWWKDALGGMVEGKGSGLVAPQQSVPDLPGLPRASLAAQQGMPTIDPQQGLVRRQQLAEAMARLNSGKTWV